MRVLIDTTYAVRAPLSGTGIYIRKLCEALERHGQVEVVRANNAARMPPAGGGMGSVRNLLSDLRWSTLELPRVARRRGVDVIHHPLPAWSLRSRLPQVVTVVDLAFERLPHCFDPRFRAYAHFAHRAATHRALAVIAISHTTAADIRELWGVPQERITVAPLGPGQEPAASPPAPDLTRSHFLYVGDNEPRKNLKTLLSAYQLYRRQAQVPLTLVLAGAASAGGPGVVLERAPAAARLAELYAGAAALIQPSLYEGFGLTALEAMSLGTPVVAARSPGLLELCAEAVLWADPHDPTDFAAAMSDVSSDAALRAKLADLGRRRAQEFSWEACAEAHLTAYSLAVK